MNRIFTIVIITLLLCATARAVPAKRGMYTVAQSDGTTLMVQQLGDEFHHSLCTADGLTIAQGADGGYYYTQAGELTTVRAHDVVGRSAGEQAFVAQHQEQLKLWSTQSLTHRVQRTQANGSRRATQVPNGGSPRVPIILVQYTDKQMSSTKEQFEAQYKTNAKSVLQYFTDQSHGQFTPQFDVYGIYTLKFSRATYGANKSNGQDKGVARMVVHAITKAADDIDWSQYDNDGDGEVDVCIVVYAGVGEAQSYVSEAIWPCQWSLSQGYIYSDGTGPEHRNGVTIDKFAVFNEVGGADDNGTVMDGIGTFCHEFSHCLGLPDFYETTYKYGYYGMGTWSLMDTGCYNGIEVDGDTPIGYSAYEKNFMGWLDYITPEANTQYTLPVFNSGSPDGDQAIKITAKNDNEYWVLENRHKQGWDACIRDEGVLITHFTYIANRWNLNTVNNNLVQLATIIPADDVCSADRYNAQGVVVLPGTEEYDLYGEDNHSFTPTSTPPMNANMDEGGVLASTTGGAGPVEKPVTEITLNHDGTASLWYMKEEIDTIVLESPVLAEATEVTYTSFVASWTHEPAVDCTYTLLVANDTAMVAEVSGITEMSHMVTDLIPGTTYTCRVKAVPVDSTAAVESAWSQAMTVTTPVLVLESPVLAEATDVTYTSFVASWTHEPAVDCTYTLLVANDTAMVAEVGGITEMSHMVTGLTPGTTYTCQVKAVPVDSIMAVESAWSDVRAVTLPNRPIISVDTTLVELSCVEGGEVSGSFAISGEYLDGAVEATITLSDTTRVFRLDPTVLSADSIMAGAVVNVYFTPDTAGVYQANAMVCYPHCDTVVVTLTGTAAMLKLVPDLAEANDVHPTSFRASWTAVPHAESYTLYVNRQIPPAEELLAEDFTTLTKDTYASIGNRMDDYLSNPGWTGKYVYVENGALRLNDRTYCPGYITSPELDLSHSEGKVTVTMRAKSVVPDSDVWLTVKTDSDSKQINLTHEAEDYMVVLDCPADEGQRVTISARAACPKRALLYDLAIYNGDATEALNAAAGIMPEPTDSTVRVITGITDTTCVVRDLARLETFNFKVEANYTDGTKSDESNIQTVTLGGEDEPEWLPGDVNADGHVDIDDMNIIINIILDLDDAEKYEGRAQVMGGDKVDIDDLNAIINIVLR